MAIVHRSSSNNWIFPLKVLLISAGVCSLAVVLKLSLPAMSDFLLSELPLFWSSLRSWLRPPYLYFVINGIIITIAASSRLCQRVEEQPQPQLMVPVPVKAEISTNFSVSTPYDAVMLKNPVNVPHQFDYDAVAATNNPVNTTLTVYGGTEPPTVYGQSEVSATEVTNPALSALEKDEDDGFVISRSTWTPQARKSSKIPAYYETEKPLVSARFGHRKNVKSSPEGGRALRVTKSKRNDTFESTWKTITDGRPIPLARHLRKSDTFETVGRHSNNDDSNCGPPEASPVKMKKYETFIKDRNDNNSSLSRSPGSGKLRKEPSLSQDELNRRVEAFIKKFNEEMRLQRQESLNQYNEMINRGAGP